MWQIAIFLALLGVGMTGIGMARTESTMTTFAGIQQLGAGILIPALLLWAMQGLPPEHRGCGMGVWSACFFLGQFTSPLLVSAGTATAGNILNAFSMLGLVAFIGAAAAMMRAINSTKLAPVA